MNESNRPIIEELPKISLNKAFGEDAMARQVVEAHLDNLSSLPEHLRLPLTQEQLRLIGEISSSQIDWIQNNLHLSISQRVPPPTRIYLLNREQFAEFIEQSNVPDASAIAIMTTAEIVAKDSENKGQLSNRLAHELIHSYCRRGIFVRSEAPKFIGGPIDLEIDTEFDRLSGFSNLKTHTLYYINELVTEMLNQEIATDAFTRGTSTIEPDSGHRYALIMFDEVLSELAERSGQSFQESRVNLYRGYLKSDMLTLRPLEQAFGEGTLRALAGYKKDYYDFDEMLALAENVFDIPPERITDRWDDFVDGKDVVLSNGVILREKPRSD